MTDCLRVIGVGLPPELLAHLLRTTSNHLDDIKGMRIDRAAEEAYMDESDREAYFEDQVIEDACLGHMGKMLDRALAGDQAQAEGWMKKVSEAAAEGMKKEA